MRANLKGLNKRSLILTGIVLSILLTVVSVAWINRTEISSAVKSRQSSRHLSKAEIALSEGNLQTALQLAIAAKQLAPGSIGVQRALLRIQVATSSPHVLNLATELFYHPEASPEDRARSLGVFLEKGDLRLFQQNIEALPESERSHPDVNYLVAGYYASQGMAKHAIQVLDQGPKNDSRHKILRAGLNAIDEDSNTRKAAQKNLATLINSNDAPTSTLAFRQLRSIPIDQMEAALLKPAAESWIKGKNYEEIKVADKLTFGTLRYLEASSDSESDMSSAVATEIIAELGNLYPIEVGYWLLKVGLFDQANQFASEATSSLDSTIVTATSRQKKYALFEIQMKALAESNRWGAQLKLLQSATNEISELQMALSKAVASKNLGKNAAARSYWQEAFYIADLTDSMRNSYLDIFKWASKAGEEDLAIRALVEASRNPLGILPSSEQLTKIMIVLVEDGRDDDLIAITNGIFSREMFSAALINNSLYLRELSGNTAPDGITIGTHLINQSPSTLGYHTTLILAHLNREQYAEALAIAERLTTRYKVDELPAAEAIIIAGAYRKSGKKHLAAERNLETNLSQLMDIERRVFEPWFED